jgi:undecaprenyl pyrophosphate synthase
VVESSTSLIGDMMKGNKRLVQLAIHRMWEAAVNGNGEKVGRIFESVQNEVKTNKKFVLELAVAYGEYSELAKSVLNGAKSFAEERAKAVREFDAEFLKK